MLAGACGVADRQGQGAERATPAMVTTVSAPVPSEPVVPRAPSSDLLDLETRWASSVPGMHVVFARETGIEPTEVARADVGDLCVRVAFEASDPVVATLTEPSGRTLATSAEGSGGLLGPEGPVCVRKGKTIRAYATGAAATRVRWVVWTARP